MGGDRESGRCVGQRWNQITEADRARVKEAVYAELAALFERNQSAWGVRPFQHDLPQAHPAFYEAVPTAVPPEVRDGCLVSFHASNGRIEPQELTVAFAGMCGKPVREAIQAAFQEALDRATG